MAGGTAIQSVYVNYWSLQDPLCQSQSLPVVRGLVAAGWRMALVTFEQPRWSLSPADREARQAALAAEGITWRPLVYHKRPPVLSTLRDIGRGALLLRQLVQTGGAGLVHSRGSVPAAMALLASRVTGARFFYDADGPLSQEYVDAGIWERGSLAYRMTRGLEDHALTRADRVAVLSELRRQEVEPRVARPVTVLPCGIDTARFRRDPVRRTALRQALGLQGLVLVYAGKSGGWYLTEPLLDFAGAVRDVIGPTTLLVLTNDPPDHFATGAARRNLPCIVRSVAPPDMPDHLAAADVGLSFRRPSPSQTAASPIKNGEYLACGLPIVSTAVAGDYPEWLRRDDLGVVVDDLGPRGLEEAARALGRLIADPTLPDRCREMAIRQVDLQGVVIPRYLEIYRELLGPSNALQYGQ